MSLGHLVATAHGQLQCHLYLSITTPKLHQYPDSWVKWHVRGKSVRYFVSQGKGQGTWSLFLRCLVSTFRTRDL